MSYVDFDEAEMVPLSPIGRLAMNCQELTIIGEIEEIRASYSRRLESVNSIKILKGGRSKTYGTLLAPNKSWEFSDDQILMGLHGRVENSRIT